MFNLSECTNLKTHSSRRVIPIHPILLPYVDTIKQLTPTEVQTLSRHINKELNTLGNYTSYSARHSFATNLINLQVPPYIVSELMGHSLGKSQTMSTYFSGTDIEELHRVVNLL